MKTSWIVEASYVRRGAAEVDVDGTQRVSMGLNVAVRYIQLTVLLGSPLSFLALGALVPSAALLLFFARGARAPATASLAAAAAALLTWVPAAESAATPSASTSSAERRALRFLFREDRCKGLFKSTCVS